VVNKEAEVAVDLFNDMVKAQPLFELHLDEAIYWLGTSMHVMEARLPTYPHVWIDKFC
jgi:hypothetical protein